VVHLFNKAVPCYFIVGESSISRDGDA